MDGFTAFLIALALAFAAGMGVGGLSKREVPVNVFELADTACTQYAGVKNVELGLSALKVTCNQFNQVIAIKETAFVNFTARAQK